MPVTRYQVYQGREMDTKTKKGLNTPERPVFVIGHKNPDTDSVCAAICYAALKQKLTGKAHVAARCGHLNEETHYVLDKFGVQPPILIKDVRAQVRDMEMRSVFADSSDISLKKAGEIMHDAEVITLCIAEKGKLSGLITSDDIVKAYMDAYDDKVLSRAKTPYKNIVETLDGEMIVGDISDTMETGKVIIAAGTPDTLEHFVEPGDFVIVGNLTDAQLKAIELKAGCLATCFNISVDQEVIEKAEASGCHIISTPHNMFTVARLINQSLPVRSIMKSKDLITFRSDEYIEEIEPVIKSQRHRYFPVLDKRNNFMGMISRRNFLGVKKKQLILVDHNEKSQAVQGMEDAEILEIIDHHRLGTVTTLSPVFFRNQPLGSTSTIIWQMYKEKGVEISKSIAGLLLSAILSDTLMFKSPTSTEIDHMAGDELSKIAGVDAEKFAREMFRAGSNLEKKTAEEIITQDFKRFSIGDKSIGIGQINAMDREELRAIREKVLPVLDKKRDSYGLSMIFLLLTDIIGEGSEVLFTGDGAAPVIENAFSCHINDDGQSGMLPGIVSRKKQFLPAVVEVMQA